MSTLMKLYVTYYTTSDAIATEQVCKEYGIPGKLVPVPRVLSAGCGMSYEASPDEEFRLRTLLQKEGIEFEDITII